MLKIVTKGHFSSKCIDLFILLFQGPVRPSEQVLRPAILQPPQAQRCKNINKTFGHGELKSCKIKENIKHKVRNSLWKERH